MKPRGTKAGAAALLAGSIVVIGMGTAVLLGKPYRTWRGLDSRGAAITCVAVALLWATVAIWRLSRRAKT